MADRSFPEKQHTKHQPDGDGSKPAHIKSSKHVGAGHMPHDSRMPHPFGQSAPDDESGEGQNN
jgi:hypothetical protein